ncbi:MAG TPA: tRNA (N6-isopentenyl adenosine(37)-C2)-methylthiotransferase MiaB, partial [Acidaminococcaceae bacterium]|nr:tRNA (N6-isopentenyl adenosine(37)-C2)-methylthiotransferase MiaB [Acidaminococcaceae bacterium]
TSHPRDMSEEVIRTVAEGTHLCEQFHVALQSGSNRILKAMNRGYTRERFLELVATIRRYIPDAAITTDIIVGFPGETDEDFEDTCRLVEEAGFDSAYTFLYSRRSGTPAARMKDQVPDDVKHARLQRLMDVQNARSLCINRAFQDRTVEVMAEGPTEKDPAVWSGRTRTNKLVLWPQNGTVRTPEGSDLPVQPGRLVHVKVTAPQTWLLKGVRTD